MGVPSVVINLVLEHAWICVDNWSANWELMNEAILRESTKMISANLPHSLIVLRLDVTTGIDEPIAITTSDLGLDVRLVSLVSSSSRASNSSSTTWIGTWAGHLCPGPHFSPHLKHRPCCLLYVLRELNLSSPNFPLGLSVSTALFLSAIVIDLKAGLNVYLEPCFFLEFSNSSSWINARALAVSTSLGWCKVFATQISSLSLSSTIIRGTQSRELKTSSTPLSRRLDQLNSHSLPHRGLMTRPRMEPRPIHFLCLTRDLTSRPRTRLRSVTSDLPDPRVRVLFPHWCTRHLSSAMILWQGHGTTG